jgi:hypothetical protein
MSPPEDEPRTGAPRERTMLAGVRNVAWGAAMVMAGLLAVIVANCIWMAYFRLDVVILSGPRVGELGARWHAYRPPRPVVGSIRSMSLSCHDLSKYASFGP